MSLYATRTNQESTMFNHPTIVRALADERRERYLAQADARIWRKPIRPRHRFRRT